MRTSKTSGRAVSAQLERIGLLLQSDSALPSVVGTVAGVRVKGSWWGHAKGHEIFQALRWLDSDPDALNTRLVSNKVTYLHRRLWPDLLAIATGREGWQTSNLPAAARRLLALVEKEGEIRMDRIRKGPGAVGLRDAVHEIEKRLLVYSDEIHTEKGSHAKLLMTWSRCPKIRSLRMSKRTRARARRTFEKLVKDLNEEYDAHGTLPWELGAGH